jgi:rare lipoprotein A
MRQTLLLLGALGLVVFAAPAPVSANTLGDDIGFGTNETAKDWGYYTSIRERGSRAEHRVQRSSSTDLDLSEDEVAAPRRSARGRTAARSGPPSLTGGSHGMASYYWQPQRVASGGWFNPSALTAAHKTLPFGTKVRVTHAASGRSVVVTINDRGPYVRGRVIDLSSAAAGAIGMKGAGVAAIRMEVLGR